MRVSLVAVTQPRIEVDGRTLSAEDLIVYTARVSSPQNRANLDTGPRLLRYCLRKGHWSIFETASMTVEVETSLAIATQILRHRSFTFQQFSQRYADASVLGFETVDPRRQSQTNRQSSHDDLTEADWYWFEAVMNWTQADALATYREALDRGIAKESARFLLPQSTTTRLYMTGNVRSWIHYFYKRCDPDAQLEHRKVAEAIRAVFSKEFPVIAGLLNEGREAEESK